MLDCGSKERMIMTMMMLMTVEVKVITMITRRASTLTAFGAVELIAAISACIVLMLAIES